MELLKRQIVFQIVENHYTIQLPMAWNLCTLFGNWRSLAASS
jgi:hypothetical protein